MKEGSLVARVEEMKASDLEYLAKYNRKIPNIGEPCVIMEGPYLSLWRFKEVMVIKLEEYPEEELNATFFRELQPPLEISIEEFIGEPDILRVLEPA